MSMAIAQLFMGGGEVRLDDVSCVATSFPSFFAILDRLTTPPPPRSSSAGEGEGDGATGAP
jgi:3-phosphoshikimate 1-carboxyvinyltransferase